MLCNQRHLEENTTMRTQQQLQEASICEAGKEEPFTLILIPLIRFFLVAKFFCVVRSPSTSVFSKRKKFIFLLPPQNLLALPFLSQKRNECFPNVSSHLLAHDLPSAATYCRANCRRVLPEVLICQQWNAIERKVLTKN